MDLILQRPGKLYKMRRRTAQRKCRGGADPLLERFCREREHHWQAAWCFSRRRTHKKNILSEPQSITQSSHLRLTECFFHKHGESGTVSGSHGFRRNRADRPFRTGRKFPATRREKITRTAPPERSTLQGAGPRRRGYDIESGSAPPCAPCSRRYSPASSGTSSRSSPVSMFSG